MAVTQGQEDPEYVAEWTNLLSELFLGLLGCSGGAFVVGESPDNVAKYGIKLSDEVDWISEGEREHIDSLVQLGGMYAMLKEFVEDFDGIEKPMPYHAAVAQGIQEVLDVYREAVLHVEKQSQRIQLHSILPLSRAFQDFFELFPDLCKCIAQITNDESVRGQDIARIFEQRASCGIPTVQACSSRMVWHCHQVLFKQMYSWMVYGRVIDPSGDFFICTERDYQWDPLIQGQNLSLAAANNMELSDQMQSAEIVESRLPPSISMSLAKDILALGQCRLVVNSICDSTMLDESFSEELWKLFSTQQRNWFKIRQLISSQRDHLAKFVWEHVNARESIASQLDDFAAFLLHTRGDVYHEFFKETYDTLFRNNPDPEKADAQARYMFNQAALNVYDGAGLAPPTNFSMTWFGSCEGQTPRLPLWHPSLTPGIYIPSYDSWDGLCIKYELEWPMHLFFSGKTIRLYGALWQLVFRLSRAQYELNNTRTTLSKMKSVRFGKERHLAALHYKISLFVSTYLSYLQMEVLSDKYLSRLKSLLSSASSFTDGNEQHYKYVMEMIEKSCLDIRQVMAVLESVFKLVKSLQMIVTSMATTELEDIAKLHIKEKMKELEQAFLSKYNVMFQLLQSNALQSGRRGESLRHLLDQMNYSGYCEQNAHRQLAIHALHVT
eukprot:jgi/Picsp_1/2719/NSC_00948-R1_gamma complex associated protein 4